MTRRITDNTRWLAIACSHFSRSPCPPRTGAPPVPESKNNAPRRNHHRHHRQQPNRPRSRHRHSQQGATSRNLHHRRSTNARNTTHDTHPHHLTGGTPCAAETSPTKKQSKSSRHSTNDSPQNGTSTSAGDKQSSTPKPTSPSPSPGRNYAPSSEAGATVTTATKYSDRTYRAKAAALRKATNDNGWPCHLCGKPIDMSLPYTHPLAFTADHLDALANGGNLLGDLAPAHRRCNSQRGRKRLAHQVRAPKTTQAW